MLVIRKVVQKKRRMGCICLSVVLSALIALSGCRGLRSSQVEEVKAVAAEGDPWIASNMIGAVDESTPVNVKDDYFLATTKEWLATVKVPSNLMSWGTMDARAVEIQDELLALCNDENIQDQDVEIMRRYMRIEDGWDARDRLGMDPIRKMAQRIMDIDSIDELTEYLISDEVRSWGNYLDVGEGEPQGESLIGLTPQVRQGREPRVQVATNKWITEEDLDSDEEVTLEDDAAYLIERLGVSRQEAYWHVDNMIDLELYLSEAMYAEGRTQERLLEPLDKDLARRIREATENETYLVDMNRSELLQCAGDFPIERLLEAYGMGEVESFQVLEPMWLIGLGECYNAEDLDLLKSHLLVGLVLDAQYYLDTDAYYASEYDEDEFTDEKDEVDESRIIELDEDTEISRSLIDTVIVDAPEIASNAYVKHCYAPRTTERVHEICDQVIGAWRLMVEEEDWLGDESKREATAKLDDMDVYVGSMATLMDVDDIELEGVDSPWEALYQFRRARTNYIVGKLLDPDSSALWISPIEVDAYYSNDDNAIFVGCGYLGGEIFDVGFSIEDQLAVVGHTVGHEVGHAFDGMGVLYDSKGNDRSWMDEKDKAAFDGRRKRVQDYLETIRPLGVEEYDGQQVSDEMIADMAGLKAVLRIAKGIDGFDYKRFFTSYCIGWKSVTTLRDLEDILAEDTHPLDATRANVSVMQTDEFVETYGVEPGDGMYLAPEDRICVW